MVLTLGWGVRGLLVCLTYSHFSSGLLFSAGFCLGFPFCVCVCVCVRAWLGAFGISMGKKKQVCNKCESCRKGENNVACASVYRVVGD